MKTYLSLIAFLSAVTAQATSLPANSHAELLQLLVGAKSKVNIAEDRTYYFANDYGQVVTLNNSAKDLSVDVSKSDSEALGIDYQGSTNSQVSYQINGPALTLNYAEFDQINGANAKYDDVSMKVQTYNYAGVQSLSVEVVQNTYYKLDTSNSDSSKWKQVLLIHPEVKKVSVTGARFVLSLSADDMQKMGNQAAAKVQETRTPGVNSCEMASEYLMKCDYSLETDYTPDTLHTVFSIKDGKISELLDANIEPGC